MLEIYDKDREGPKRYYLDLKDTGKHVQLIIRDEDGDEEGCGHLLRINKETGRVRRFDGVDDKFGFDLHENGRVKDDSDHHYY